MKFTGNKEIDKQIKRGLGPLDPVNMDDYWDPHDTFLNILLKSAVLTTLNLCSKKISALSTYCSLVMMPK